MIYYDYGYHRLDVCTLALGLLTNSTVGDGATSITFQLLPVILVRRLSEEFLKPAFTIMSSELATKNTFLKNVAKGKNSFYRYYVSIFGSLVLISRCKVLEHNAWFFPFRLAS